MKQLSFLFAIVLLYLSFSVKAQNNREEILYKDSIRLDSVCVINEKLLSEVNRFISRNKKPIDTNSYIMITTMGYSDEDINSFKVVIGIENDLNNDLLSIGIIKSGYCYINNTLVLFNFFDKRHSPDLLFKRTNTTKYFHFYHKRYVKLTLGISHTSAGYRVKVQKNSKLKISSLYYIKYPYSRIQKYYYRIRYKGYF